MHTERRKGLSDITADNTRPSKQQSRSLPNVKTSQRLKRKRSGHGESYDAPLTRKRRHNQGDVSDHTSPTSDDDEAQIDAKEQRHDQTNFDDHTSPHDVQLPPSPTVTSSPTMETPNANTGFNFDRMREIVESQFSMEIILKHTELRLIDQELAKCEVALEQLRRCAENPYPGPGFNDNNPYAVHYARWLLPVSEADGYETQATLPAGRRATRSTGEGSSVVGNARPTRRSGNFDSTMQALPNGYPQPKDRVGPMIVTRKSDGVAVKLVCLDCHRDNFSSTQGFINHCRIAHSRSFANHDAAADAAGQPVKFTDTGTVVEDNTSDTSASLVHPLVRTAPMDGPQPEPQSHDKPETEQQHHSDDYAVSPSYETGHLSNFMQSKGVDVDLEELLDDPEDKVMNLVSESEGEEMDADAEPLSSEGEDQASHPRPVPGSRPQTMSNTSDGKEAMDHARSQQSDSDADVGEPSSENEDQDSHNPQPVRTTRSQTMLSKPDGKKATGRRRSSQSDSDDMGKPSTSESEEGARSDGKKAASEGEDSDASISESLASEGEEQASHRSRPRQTRRSQTMLNSSSGKETRDADPMEGSANLSPNAEPSLVSDDDADDEYILISESEDSNSNGSEMDDDDGDDRHIGEVEVQDDEISTSSDQRRDTEVKSGTNNGPSLSKPMTRSIMKKRKDGEGLSSAERRNRLLRTNRVKFLESNSGPSRHSSRSSKQSGPTRSLRSSRHLRSSKRQLD